MTGALRIIGSFILAALVTVGIIWAWPMPVHAQGVQCVTIEQDKALYDKPGSGFDYLGILPVPYTESVAVFYRRHRDNATVVSPIINGCVDTSAYTFGPYVGPVRAPEATPSVAPIPAPLPRFRLTELSIGQMRSDILELNSLRR